MTRNIIRRVAISLLAILISLFSQHLLLISRATVIADNRAAEDRGAAGLGQAIKRLGVVASALHTGAHPDDEDSGLLAYLARGRQARTAYLSLTRGDGGQNLIGPELYEALGVIRTEELLAARRIDGASQFFTRAYDFGFSKARDEALAKWDRDEVLADMVRVIRTFRPTVIVSAWTGTPADGHGHHQAAGFLTKEAYAAAADPSRYPQQLAEGLRPWQAMKLYVRVPGREELPKGVEPISTTVTVNKGQFDPVLGRSYYEIAMQGRSQHRSQDQGALERRGPQYTRLHLEQSAVGTPKEEKDIFDAIDTSLTGIAQRAGQASAQLRGPLADVQQDALEAAAKYNPLKVSMVAEPIARGLKRIRDIRADLPSLQLSEAQMFETDFLLKQKEDDFADALAKAEGIIVDCIADDEVVTPGQTFNVSVSGYADTGSKVTGVSLTAPRGWAVSELKRSSSSAEGRLLSQADYKVTVAPDAELTQPYWLMNPRKGDMFSPGKGGTGIEPNAPPAITARVEYEIEGQKIVASQPAQYRYADKALGEIRRELKVAPAISITVGQNNLVYPLPTRGLEREATVSVTNNLKEGARGTLVIGLPEISDAGEKWRASPSAQPIDLKREGQLAGYSFKIAPRPDERPDRFVIPVSANVGGRQYDKGYQVISYPHVESRFFYQRPVINARVLDVKVAPGLNVGYIEGAGDDFANALERLGVKVERLKAQDLAEGDLSRFDTIVAGIRVYEVRPDVIANNARLLEYVKNGGTLVMQYNKGEIATGNFTPFPVKMEPGMPARVTDEAAPVTILDPANPLFNFPNKITERDFEGWVQERGAYFFSEWDKGFKPLLASHDPGEEMKRGGELVAQYGKGYYIYTAYAWFRQLPQGVPGAYRLIANLVSFPKAKAGPARQGQKRAMRK
ncbi:MAG TPA: PIG-L family deacetylase [Blastocatellia bacterium]|nr:PIG-L family deacetylase [Blastocatellia bacterium]